MRGDDAYRRAIADARRSALALTQDLADDLLELLERVVDELAARVVTGMATRSDRETLALARAILSQLAVDMASATRRGIELTTSTVSTAYAEATAALYVANGLEAPVLFQRLNVRAAQAVLARRDLAVSLRTIRSTSIDAVESILRQAILEGTPQRLVAQRIRLHILGSEIFPDRVLLDRRRIGFEVVRLLGYEPTRENLNLVRSLGRSIAHRARRIARTEPMVAQWEANRQMAVESPVVAGFRWRVSSRHQVRDQCDTLAETDFYGLGAGIHPADLLPARPHPHCICVHTHVLRALEDWSRPKPVSPPLRIIPSAEVLELSPSEHESLVASLQAAEAGRAAA